MRNVICYDLEIARSVEAVGGWKAAREGKAGVSCLVCVNPFVWQFRIFMEDNFDQAAAMMNPAELCVSYNGNKFDDPVLRGIGLDVHDAPRLDLLEKIQQKRPFQKGWKLDDVCQRTLGVGKTHGSGVLAPHLFQRKFFGKLLTYAIHDVWLLARLYLHVLNKGFVIAPGGALVKLDVD